MDRLSTNRKVFRELSHWYLCVVLLLLIQLLVALVWSFFGPLGNGLEHFLELVYVSPVSWIGNAFFEDRMSLGNAPLGMGLLLLVIILYAFLGGTVIYFICRISSSALSRGKHALSVFCFALCLLLISACGKSDSEEPKPFDGNIASTVFPLKNGIELEMIQVQPGVYMVGLPRKDPLWRADIDWREVIVSVPYWLGRFEVTQEQWEAIMDGEKRPDGFDLNNPSLYKGKKRPVDAVTRNDVNRFIERINELCAERLPEGYRFELPDPVRWEIACRAGTTTRMPWGDSFDPKAANLISMGELEKKHRRSE